MSLSNSGTRRLNIVPIQKIHVRPEDSGCPASCLWNVFLLHVNADQRSPHIIIRCRRVAVAIIKQFVGHKYWLERRATMAQKASSSMAVWCEGNISLMKTVNVFCVYMIRSAKYIISIVRCHVIVIWWDNALETRALILSMISNRFHIRRAVDMP